MAISTIILIILLTITLTVSLLESSSNQFIQSHHSTWTLLLVSFSTVSLACLAPPTLSQQFHIMAAILSTWLIVQVALLRLIPLVITRNFQRQSRDRNSTPPIFPVLFLELFSQSTRRLLRWVSASAVSGIAFTICWLVGRARIDSRLLGPGAATASAVMFASGAGVLASAARTLAEVKQYVINVPTAPHANLDRGRSVVDSWYRHKFGFGSNRSSAPRTAVVKSGRPITNIDRVLPDSRSTNLLDLSNLYIAKDRYPPK